MTSDRPIISEAALADLDEIWLFIGRESFHAADRIVDELYTAIYRLGENPGLGHLRDDLIEKPLRFWNVHHYLIIYRADVTPIEIVRVVSGYRDLASLLGR